MINDFRTWLREFKSLSEATARTYSDCLGMVQKRLGNTSLDEAGRDQLVGAIGKLGSPYTKNVAKHSLKKFLEWRGRSDLLAGMKFDRIVWEPKQPPTPEQLDRVLARADVVERALILTLYSTGMRISELVGNPSSGWKPVLVQDVDFERAEIKRPVTGKGGRKGNVIFMLRTQETLKALKTYLGERRSRAIFSFSRYIAWRLIREAGKRARVNLHPHLLRHATATSMDLKGFPIGVIQATLRHARLDTTGRYFGHRREDLRKARERYG